ncbi:hypothetical protein C8A05DRAFT_46468 [Staphylotrichum tortipilum]|uniref:Zn(2)-C6 fungal-type domain-containing protein n=1 Tax=Staphylotrichum tortipilum TaxID=2831512 RepID=A0AAN6MFY4_9PEZI|nr:hypothetical protein C8A05DRAFT_46468 [Staphylotrichum longicolle]
MASLRVTAFANTFLLPNDGHGGPMLKVVGPHETRKKRPHRCDEGEPCRNCIKRKESCVRISPEPSGRPRTSDHESLPQLMSPPPELSCYSVSEPVNLLHMELLHHFERYSIPSLPFPEIWPRMLQLAFQSRQHTYLVNAMLSFAAAHLAHLHPGHPTYHRAKSSLLDTALQDYRETLSGPITPDNCDALLSTANLIHYLMWCDLSFVETEADRVHRHHHDHDFPDCPPSTPPPPPPPLDLSGDRLYFLSTGVRQIFFMSWPLFQLPQSVFRTAGVLQPCMVLEEVVEARGLNWRRYARTLMDLYDNPRYHGGRDGPTSSSPPPPRPSSSSSSSCSYSTPPTPRFSTSPTTTPGCYLEGVRCSFSPGGAPAHNVITLWQSYKEGEAYVVAGGAHDEARTRAAYKRLAARLAVAMAFIADEARGSGEGDGGVDGGVKYPVAGGKGGGGEGGWKRPRKPTDIELMRYVSTFPMMCFGPLLDLISSGDSRMLVVLLHMYRIVGVLLAKEMYWWCKRRVLVMQDVIGRELHIRGLDVCLRRRDEVV